MSTPTPQQRRATIERAYAQRVLVNGVLVAAHLPAEKHGRAGTYTYWGCRCQPCREAGTHNRPAKRSRDRRKWLARRTRVAGRLIALQMPAQQHGTAHGATFYGCQCARCEEAIRNRRAA